MAEWPNGGSFSLQPEDRGAAVAHKVAPSVMQAAQKCQSERKKFIL